MKKKLLILFAAVALSAGCGETKVEIVPEANAATCAPDVFEAALKEMRSEVNRASFTEGCRSFHAAKKMRTWTFTPSPESKY